MSAAFGEGLVKMWSPCIRRKFPSLVALLALLSAVVVCQAPSAGASQDTKSPILIGEVGPFSGTQAGLGGEGLPKAWADWTNAHGGVDGHPVKMVFGDDQSITSVDSSLVENLVTSDHVVAFLGTGSADNQALSFLTAHHIPVLQSTSSTNASNFFPLTASQSAVTLGLIQSAKLGGAHKVGVFYCTASSFCSQAVDPFEAAAAKLGLDHSFEVGISLESPNYTAECFAAKDNHVQALFAEAAASTVQQIAQECAAQGYKPIYLLDGPQAALSMDKVSALNGARTIITTFPWFEDNTPATKAFQQAIRRYDPNLLTSTAYGPETALAWASAQAIVQAVQLGDVGNTPTGPEILAGLHKFKNQTLDGLIAPVTWKPNAATLTHCYFVVATNNGKWEAPNGYGPECAP